MEVNPDLEIDTLLLTDTTGTTLTISSDAGGTALGDAYALTCSGGIKTAAGSYFGGDITTTASLAVGTDLTVNTDLFTVSSSLTQVKTDLKLTTNGKKIEFNQGSTLTDTATGILLNKQLLFTGSTNASNQYPYISYSNGNLVLSNGTGNVTIGDLATTISGKDIIIPNGGAITESSTGRGIQIADGNIIVTSDSDRSGANTGALQVNGGCYIAQDLYIGGNFTVEGTTTFGDVSFGAITATSVTSGNYYTSSDYRIKDNVTELTDSFTVDNLRPVSYVHKDTEKPSIGFIAHEVQEHFPELVTGEKDGDDTQTLNYIGLIGVLVKEIQDLKARVNELEKSN